jgi:hypothetical protein
MIIIPHRFSTKASEMIRFSNMLRLYTKDAWWGWRKALEIRTPSPYEVMQTFVIIGKMAKTIGASSPKPFKKGLGLWQISPYQGEEYEIHTDCFTKTPEEFVSIAENFGCTCKMINSDDYNLSISASDITKFAEIGYEIGFSCSEESKFDNKTYEEIMEDIKKLKDYKYWGK